MYQRSGDLGLGIPFNIASASLLTYVIAKMTNKIPKKLIMSIGETHIYKNHIEAIKEQIKRTPYPFPKLEITKNINFENLNDLEYGDFNLLGYDSYSKIPMTMAI
jgi:thymidylate synthase